MSNKQKKTPKGSEVIMTEMVLPGDTNALGTIFGGKVMERIDIAGAIAARRHSNKNVVTASIDAMSFIAPIQLGHVVTFLARVNWTGKTSMEVGCRVISENPNTGERSHTASAHLTYVAVDSNGRPASVPTIHPQTAEDKRRFQNAIRRRKALLAMRKATEARKHVK